MTEGSGQPGEDPSMEDILASIRRILNDDPQAGAPAQDPAHDTTHAAAGDDVFVLDQTMLIEEPAVVPDEPFATEHTPPEPSSTGHLSVEHAPAPEEPLLSPSTTAAASASMGALVRVIGQQHTPVYRGGPTLEDMVRDEIRPLVKAWLDENLPPMVERMVRAEIARVTGSK